MSEPATEDYIRWLAPQITPRRNRDFSDLLHIMFEKEFVMLVVGDDNRIQDGCDLRIEFFRNAGIPPYVDPEIFGPVSVLEVLIGVARRVAFLTDENQEDWAWTLMKHLGLDRMSGRLGPRRQDQIEDILNRLIFRQYEPDGQGGFFPLAWPKRDQRECEIWTQMNAYLVEQEDPHEGVSMY